MVPPRTHARIRAVVHPEHFRRRRRARKGGDRCRGRAHAKTHPIGSRLENLDLIERQELVGRPDALVDIEEELQVVHAAKVIVGISLSCSARVAGGVLHVQPQRRFQHTSLRKFSSGRNGPKG